MGKNSKISWCDDTFNPWWGCQRVSPGCQHCYAEALDKRVGGAMVEGKKVLRWGPNAPRVRTSAKNWSLPLKWNELAKAAGVRRRVFCASMADVFEQLQPGQAGQLDVWRLELFDLIARTPHLDWLLLTKRPQLVMRGIQGAYDAFPRTPGGKLGLDLAEAWIDGKAPPNVWLGTTVEDQLRANERIPELLKVPAVVRFLSCEPLLEPVDLKAHRPRISERYDSPLLMPDWVIIGGESGGGARRFNVAWARDLVRQARAAGAAAFVKQMGAFVVDRNDVGFDADTHVYVDTGLPVQPQAWPEPYDVEHDINGYREEFQGADCRVRLRSAAGVDITEWPVDLRVREFPTPRAP